VVAQPDDEIHQRIVRVTSVDSEGGDAGAGDHREREEAFPDDVTKRLETADALPDAFEPAIGADGLEGERLLAGHRGKTFKITRFVGPFNARAATDPPNACRRLSRRIPHSAPDPSSTGTAGASPNDKGKNRNEPGLPNRIAGARG